MSTTRRLLAYLLNQKGKIALGVIFTLIMALAEVSTGVVFKGLLDSIPTYKKGSTVQISLDSPLKRIIPKRHRESPRPRIKQRQQKNDKYSLSWSLDNKDEYFRGMSIVCSIFFLLILIQSTSRYLRDTVFDCAIQRVLQKFKSEICTKLLQLPQEFHDKYNTGDLISRITYDVTMLNQVIDLFVELSRALIFLLIFLPILISINWIAASFAIAMCPACYFLIRWASRHIRNASRETTDNVGDYTAFLDSRLNGIKTIQAFNTSNSEVNSFDESVKTNYLLNRRIILWTRMLKPSSESIGLLGIVLISIYLIHRLAYTDGTSIGDIGLFLYISRAAWKPIKKVADSIGRLQIAIVSTKKIFRLLDSDLTETINKHIDEPVRSISVDSLNFSYSTANTIIKDLSFDINTGETLVITGPVGCGKSTLVYLLLGLYNPQNGEIKFNNQEGRAKMAAAGPAFPLLAETVIDNISYASTTPIPDKLTRALETIEVTADARVESLSAGQQDFVRLSRALATEPEVIILDEALNSMDQKVQKQALELIQDVPICIIVSRDINILPIADRVVELDNDSY